MNQFNSFVWAGFECTYALAENKRRFDLLRASRHDELCVEDYVMIYAQGMRTVREGLAWHEIDQGNGLYDFSRFEPMMKAANEVGIQQIWDLNHFDFPENVDPFSNHFTKRYAEYAKRVVSLLRRYIRGTIFITPMNEPSFFSWMCDNGLWAPYEKGKGTAFKQQLMKAAIAAMDAIWEEDADVQFIHTDPYMYRQPLRIKSKKEQEFCQNFNEEVKFHSWDMLAGKRNPELGGNPKYLNFLGINYYFYNQQFVGLTSDGKFIFRSIGLNHKKRLTVSDILKDVYSRYKALMVITETGSYRKRRTIWWDYILKEVSSAVSTDLPLYGICAYPTLDIKKGAGFIVPQSGLWDFDQTDPTCKRIPHEESLRMIRDFNS